MPLRRTPPVRPASVWTSQNVDSEGAHRCALIRLQWPWAGMRHPAAHPLRHQPFCSASPTYSRTFIAARNSATSAFLRPCASSMVACVVGRRRSQRYPAGEHTNNRKVSRSDLVAAAHKPGHHASHRQAARLQQDACHATQQASSRWLADLHAPRSLPARALNSSVARRHLSRTSPHGSNRPGIAASFGQSGSPPVTSSTRACPAQEPPIRVGAPMQHARCRQRALLSSAPRTSPCAPICSGAPQAAGAPQCSPVPPRHPLPPVRHLETIQIGLLHERLVVCALARRRRLDSARLLALLKLKQLVLPWQGRCPQAQRAPQAVVVSMRCPRPTELLLAAVGCGGRRKHAAWRPRTCSAASPGPRNPQGAVPRPHLVRLLCSRYVAAGDAHVVKVHQVGQVAQDKGPARRGQGGRSGGPRRMWCDRRYVTVQHYWDGAQYAGTHAGERRRTCAPSKCAAGTGHL